VYKCKVNKRIYKMYVSLYTIITEVPRDMDMSEDEDEQDADDRYSRK
jgi:hypothetical protein